MQWNEKIALDERLLLWIIVAAALGSLILLTIAMRNGYLTQFDHAVLSWLHKIKNPALDHYFSAVTWMGSLWLLLPLYLLVVLSLSRYYEYIEKLIGIGFWGTFFTVYALKFSLERKRPHFFSAINEVPIDPSFPSAHTAQIVAFTLLLWVIASNGSTTFSHLFGAVLVFIALSVALSRMYLQVHYPSDVLAGALVALIWVCIALSVVKSGGMR